MICSSRRSRRVVQETATFEAVANDPRVAEGRRRQNAQPESREQRLELVLGEVRVLLLDLARPVGAVVLAKQELGRVLVREAVTPPTRPQRGCAAALVVDPLDGATGTRCERAELPREPVEKRRGRAPCRVIRVVAVVGRDVEEHGRRTWVEEIADHQHPLVLELDRLRG